MPKRSKSKKEKKKKSTRKKHPVKDGDILENSIGRDVPICNFMKKPGLICLFLFGILCIVLFTTSYFKGGPTSSLFIFNFDLVSENKSIATININTSSIYILI